MNELKNDLLRWVLQYVPESDRNAVFGVCKMWRKHYRFVNPPLSYIRASQSGNKRFAALLFACCETALLCCTEHAEQVLLHAVDNNRLDHVRAIVDCAPHLSSNVVRSSIIPLLCDSNNANLDNHADDDWNVLTDEHLTC